MGYVNIARLGGGYFGEVWLEYDDGLDRPCACKYLNVHRLSAGVDVYAEAKVMMAARHDNVVQVYAADDVNGQPVIRMEYLSAGSVQDMYGGDPVPVFEAVRFMEDACRGVEHLHNRGILHRDVKPANLLLADDGSIKVGDFGLACVRSAVSAGPSYAYVGHLPPESLASGGTGVIESDVGDVYALGVTAYRLLNGDDMLRATLSGVTDIADVIVRGRFPDRRVWQPHVHDRLRRVVRKAMHLDPSRRYATAASFRHHLEQARPAVSWWPSVSPAWRGWEGAGTGDRTTWRSRIDARPRGAYVFTIERRLPGRTYRKLAADSQSFSDARSALRHASTVLARVAEAGH